MYVGSCFCINCQGREEVRADGNKGSAECKKGRVLARPREEGAASDRENDCIVYPWSPGGIVQLGSTTVCHLSYLGSVLIDSCLWMFTCP